MRHFPLVTSLLLVGTVVAQIPNIPKCVLSCSTDAAAAAGCNNYMDLPCICTKSEFMGPAAKCVLDTCSTEDAVAGTNLQKTVCAAYSGNNGTTSSSTGASPTSTSTNSAPGGNPASIGLGVLALGAAFFAI